MKTGIVLVGPGRAGRAFARSWTGSGGTIVLVGRQAAATKAFALTIPGAEAVALDDRLPLACDVLILAVPDDVIGSLARRISPRVACRFALHFSGALPSSELAPLSSGGAKLASMHPLRAFSGSGADDWSGAFVAIEGEESAAKTATRLCRHVGARPHPLAAENKPLYHAAATLAAGGSGSLLSLATRLWTRAGLSEEEGRAALAGLAAGAVDAVARLPFDRALTGPVARRDVETVRLHRDALARVPDLGTLYALLARETLRRTPGRGREDEIAVILAELEAAPGESARTTDEFPDEPGRKG
jgi:predicted short-subunit dehydrogenase-like oxidoreductase (DUF2520 family)